jgi:hypothetical protein
MRQACVTHSTSNFLQCKKHTEYQYYCTSEIQSPPWGPFFFFACCIRALFPLPAVLVRRLMRFQGQHVSMNALHHSCCVISRRHFLVALAPGPVARSGPGFLCIFGSKGSSNRQFNHPRLTAWDVQGNAVVADDWNDRLQVVRLWDGACIRTIGSPGSGAGQFNRPYGVACDSAGHIIVADSMNHRVQVLRYSDGSHVRTMGSQGSGNGEFDRPYVVLIDGQGRIVVSVFHNNRAQVLQ